MCVMSITAVFFQFLVILLTDKCTMASSFSLSRSLIDWFSCSSSSTLVCIPAPCLKDDERLRMSSKVQSYEISLLSLNLSLSSR